MTTHRLYLSSGPTPRHSYTPASEGLYTTFCSLTRVVLTPLLPFACKPTPRPPLRPGISFLQKKSPSFLCLGSAPRVISLFTPHALRVCILSSCPPKRTYLGFPFKFPLLPSHQFNPPSAPSAPRRPIYTQGPSHIPFSLLSSISIYPPYYFHDPICFWPYHRRGLKKNIDDAVSLNLPHPPPIRSF